MVVKMRRGVHSRDIREYEITPGGLVIGERLTGYDRLITRIARRTDRGTRADLAVQAMR
jgi:circadian clock protein KaiC